MSRGPVVRRGGIFAVLIVLFSLCLVFSFSHAAPGPSDKDTAIVAKALSVRALFVENRGLVPDGNVAFYSRTGGGNAVHVTREGAIGYFLADISLIESPVGGKGLSPSGITPAATVFHSYTGSDPASWRENIPTYEALHIGEAFPGIVLTLQTQDNYRGR